jgi:hypothetical protein
MTAEIPSRKNARSLEGFSEMADEVVRNANS